MSTARMLRLQGERKIAAGLEEFILKWRLAGADWQQRARKILHFQKKLYTILVQHLRAEPIAPFFLRSLHRYGMTEPNLVNVQRSLLLLRGHRPEIVWANMITWLGGWPTSRRMQKRNALGQRQADSCLFGCTAEDSQQHYFWCPRMKILMDRITVPGPRRFAQQAGIWRSRDRASQQLQARTAARLHAYRTLRLGTEWETYLS